MKDLEYSWKAPYIFHIIIETMNFSSFVIFCLLLFLLFSSFFFFYWEECFFAIHLLYLEIAEFLGVNKL